MTRRRHLLVPAAALALAMLVAPNEAPSASSTQTLAAGSDTVTVDVTVRAGGRLVNGLSATDFVLTDNGVKQQVDSVDRTPIPLDVTLVLDVSGDQRGLRIDPVSPSAVVGALNERVRPIGQMLRPSDRLRVLAMDSYVRQVVPLQSAPSVRLAGDVTAGGLASLNDAIVLALLQPVEPSRRHVVIVSTKGKDTVSATSVQAIRNIVERSDARLHIVLQERDADNEDSRYKLQCSGLASDVAPDLPPETFTGLCWPTRRFWVPFVRQTLDTTVGVDNAPMHSLMPAGQTLAEASAETGGRLHQGGGLTAQTPASVLRAVLDELQQSYSVRYTPQGVKRDGWHSVSVTVATPGATVRARPGYTMLPAAPPGPERSGLSVGPYTARLPATYEELVEAYSRLMYEHVTRALRGWREPEALIRRLNEDGNPWPATPRREATFALEIAEAGLFSRRQETVDETLALLKRFQWLVRHPLGPDEFERYWLWAELTMLQGKIRPGTAESFLNYALARFPNEPRFLLAHAIVTDQYFPFMGVMRSTAQTAAGTASADHIDRVTERYAAAIKSLETATEARVRLAWFLHRVGRHEEALARLDEVRDEPNDRAMRYLHQLFRGHILGALGRPAAAVEAFRHAIVQWPTAQSAQVGLMNALLHTGGRVEAEAIAERIQTAPADQADPWFTYWLGDYRLYPAAIAALQELIR